jgi:hypothetical protein
MQQEYKAWFDARRPNNKIKQVVFSTFDTRPSKTYGEFRGGRAAQFCG